MSSLWLSAEALELAARILHSHQRGFGRPLVAGLGDDASLEQRAQALFATGTVVLAHDGADPSGDPGPCLTYANRAALALWRRPWAEQVGMPSRLTAEPAERSGRAQMLMNAQEQHAISGYCGIRIDSQGRRFQIHNARLWTLRDRNNQACGQAAAFNAWWWL